MLYAALREILSGFEVHEGQYLQPGTDKVYKRVAKSRKWKENSVQLDHGAKGHWLGHHDAKYVMIYFHGEFTFAQATAHDTNGICEKGGGFIAPATPGHMKYQFALQKHLRAQGIDISIFSLSYILAPKSIYPVQIQSALSALTHLITTTGRDPSTILLGGDSAGGNLVAGLLLHLGHPHPKIPPFVLEKRLKGALLISPWVSFDTASSSFKGNEKSDYLTVTALNRASTTFIGSGTAHDEYSEPVTAPVEWWREVAEKVVDEVLVWGGGGEVLIDGIRAFGGHLISGFREPAVVEAEKAAGNEAAEGIRTLDEGKGDRVKLVVSPGEAHEEMIIDYVLKIRKEEEGSREIKKWLTEVLKRGDGDVKEKVESTFKEEHVAVVHEIKAEEIARQKEAELQQLPEVEHVKGRTDLAAEDEKKELAAEDAKSVPVAGNAAVV